MEPKERSGNGMAKAIRTKTTLYGFNKYGEMLYIYKIDDYEEYSIIYNKFIKEFNKFTDRLNELNLNEEDY